MPKATIIFPNTAGATSIFKLQNGEAIKLFMIDAKVPLYNMFVGGEKFFANAEQVTKVVTEREANLDSAFVRPNWKWVFDGGFDKSIDGRGAVGWCLAE